MEGDTERAQSCALPAGEPYASRFGGRAAALLVAHPGHELRVHGWMSSVRPRVFVLTDGSGRAGVARIARSRAVVRAAGAAPGALFGCLTDRELYEALRARKTDLFLQLTRELADQLVALSPATVVVDALEGAILAHDVLHLCTRVALARAAARSVRPVLLVFSLMDHPWRVAGSSGPALRIELDAEARARKETALRGYAEIRAEVQAHRAVWGDAVLGTEVLREAEPLDAALARLADAAQPCAWERHGEALVRAGVYATSIRRGEHLLPLLDGLLGPLGAGRP